MKKRIIIFIGAIAFLIGACTPIENRDEAGPVLTADQLEVAIEQEPAGSNSVVLKNLTPGVIML